MSAAEREDEEGGRAGSKDGWPCPSLLGKPSTRGTCAHKLRVAAGGPLVPELTIIGTPHEYRQGPQELGITTQSSQGWNTWAMAHMGTLEPGIPWGAVTSWKSKGISREKLLPTPCCNNWGSVVPGKGEPVPNGLVRLKATACGGDILCHLG